MSKPMIVGLTGGIGSGKTTCAAVFELLGVPLYYADDRAKALYTSDAVLMTEVKSLLGEEAYDSKGFNREYVGRLVFKDPELLNALERLVHPRVKDDFEQWAHQHSSEPYLIKEAAILLESGSYKDCDKIICVTAGRQERIKRVVQRDRTGEDAVKARMDKQWSDAERLQFADYVIVTDSDASVIEQINAVHSELIGVSSLNA